MKKFVLKFSLLVVALCGSVVLKATEPAGSSCDNPIQLTAEYDATITDTFASTLLVISNWRINSRYVSSTVNS